MLRLYVGSGAPNGRSQFAREHDPDHAGELVLAMGLGEPQQVWCFLFSPAPGAGMMPRQAGL